jgi:hypothetical protein
VKIRPPTTFTSHLSDSASQKNDTFASPNRRGSISLRLISSRSRRHVRTASDPPRTSARKGMPPCRSGSAAKTVSGNVLRIGHCFMRLQSPAKHSNGTVGVHQSPTGGTSWPDLYCGLVRVLVFASWRDVQLVLMVRQSSVSKRESRATLIHVCLKSIENMIRQC